MCTPSDQVCTCHRTRTNRRPDPPLRPATVAEIDQVLADVIEDRN